MKIRELLHMAPVAVDRPWGGTRLASYGKPVGERLAESWEVADLPNEAAPAVPDPTSKILGGSFDGRTLSELAAIDQAGLMGAAALTDDGRFPLLIKLIDANEPLSVQVHPPADVVASHPHARLKTESWYVVAAESGSMLYLDVRDGVTIDDIDASMGSSRLVDLLRAVPAVVGEFHHLPAGLVHALGAGTVVAEVQTPSDTTYRMYDWSEEYGRQPREMHPDEALASVRIAPPEAFSLPAEPTVRGRELCRNPHYWIAEHRSRNAHSAGDGAPSVLMVVEGTVEVLGETLVAGATAIVPAALGSVDITMRPDSVVLEVGLPT